MAQIIKRNTSWGYRVSYYDNYGKRKFINKFGFKRKSDAQEAARNLELQKKSTDIEKKENITFAQYYFDWVETFKLGKLDPNTERRYLAFGEQLQDYFGNTLLKDVTKAKYQKFIDNYSTDRSEGSIKRVNNYVKTILGDAIDEQLINNDFTRNVIINGNKPKSADLKYLQYDEAKKLKKYALSRCSLTAVSFYTILVGLATGCRYGEIVGITWDDIDFKNKTILIDKTYDYKQRTGFKKTKTMNSIRTIAVDNSTIELLKKLKKEQNETFMRQGYRNDKNLVFLNNRHLITSDTGANKLLKSCLQNPEVNAKNIITFHGLRHTHASILISKGISLEYISERLGHSNTTITAKVYAHLLNDKRIAETQKTLNIINSL